MLSNLGIQCKEVTDGFTLIAYQGKSSGKEEVGWPWIMDNTASGVMHHLSVLQAGLLTIDVRI